jgi:hypothetical protein
MFGDFGGGELKRGVDGGGESGAGGGQVGVGGKLLPLH